MGSDAGNDILAGCTRPAAQLGDKEAMGGQRVRLHGQHRNTRRSFHFSTRCQHSSGTTANHLTRLQFGSYSAQDAPVRSSMLGGCKDQGKVSAIATRLAQRSLGCFTRGLFSILLF